MNAQVIPIHREPTERERLERLHTHLLSQGNSLLRMSRQCSQTANEFFDQADQVERTLRELP